MAGYEYSFSVLCENCKEEFYHRMMLCSSVNMDAASGMVSDFLNDRMNLVTCPNCGANFVYERPFVAFGIKKKYAILADGSLDGKSKIHGRARLYEMFSPKMRFRRVDFLCEAAEKARIFEAGLDDRATDVLKRKVFDASFFADKRDAMELFRSADDDTILFEYRDYLGNVIEERSVAMSEYLLPDDGDNCISDGLILWKRTD